MALYIANPETSELAEKLSKLMGTTKTEAVRRVVSAEVKRLENEATREERLERIREITKEIASQFVRPQMAQEEIDDWLYDENGLPH